MNRLKHHYENVARQNLLCRLHYKNLYEIPKLEKITVSWSSPSKFRGQSILPALYALELMTSQKAKVIKAKKPIASYKLRKNSILGAKVTLRNDNMYNFLDKLITIVLPKVKDFNGFANLKFDGKGNFNIGLDDYLVFPEIEHEYRKFEMNISGLTINITTTAKNDLEAKLLLSSLQLPV